MSRRRPIRLRTRLALSMVLFILAGFGLIYCGSCAIDAWKSKQLVNVLSPAARRAYEAAVALRIPDPGDHQALLAVLPALNAEMEATSDAALFGLLGLTLILGAAAAVALSNRLVAPIERVARAARRVAEGDLTARAPFAGHGAGEIRQLVEDFNRMVDALAAAAHETRESSAAIAHELRTPLTILRGRLQGIQDRVFGAGPAEIEGLLRQVGLLTRIVDDLMVVSMASSAGLRLTTIPIDLAEEVRGLAPTVTPDLVAAGMRLELELHPAPCRADPVRVRQALMCLLDNALRHARSGGVVKVETVVTATEANLRVLDRGPGLPPEGPERVFERFWRADISRSRATGGSGLGLSVARAIAQAHGGGATAHPREGGGAIFDIRLPT